MHEGTDDGRSRVSEADGLSLVELIIAVFIISLAFTALASTLIATLTAVSNNEARVRASAIGNEAIEQMTTIPWPQVGLYWDDDDDVVTDFEGELVALLPNDGPAVPPNEDTDVQDGIEYTITRWVTWYEDDGGQDLKRMIVEVSWDVRGVEQEIRFEGLRAPDPGENVELEITDFQVVRSSDGLARVGLQPHDDADHPLHNDSTIRADLVIGDVGANVTLSFVDRDGQPRSVNMAQTTDGETSERTAIISQNSFPFPHGPFSFTVTAIGSEGQIATATAVVTFFQDVRVLTPTIRQGGSDTTIVEVCEAGDTFELADDLTIRAEVWGLTPSEASDTGALEAQWGTFLDGVMLDNREPDPPLRLSELEDGDSFTDDGGWLYDKTVGKGKDFDFADETIRFEVVANRVVDGDTANEFLDGDDEDSVDISVQSTGSCT